MGAPTEKAERFQETQGSNKANRKAQVMPDQPKKRSAKPVVVKDFVPEPVTSWTQKVNEFLEGLGLSMTMKLDELRARLHGANVEPKVLKTNEQLTREGDTLLDTLAAGRVRQMVNEAIALLRRVHGIMAHEVTRRIPKPVITATV